MGISLWLRVATVALFVAASTAEKTSCKPLAGQNKPFCPVKSQTVFASKTGTTFNLMCCKDPAEAKAKKTAALAALPPLPCQVTRCIASTEITPDSNLCTNLPQYMMIGGEMIYEENMRDECVDQSGQHGFASACCPKDSKANVLLSLYGAENREFPHQARLLSEHAGVKQGCGGTVYNKDYIVTAAHCVVVKETGELYDNDKVTVTLGTNIGMLADKENTYGVEEIIVHPDYTRLANQSQEMKELLLNDIAVLKLDREIEFSRKVQALEIAPHNFEPKKYAGQVVIAGWGQTNAGVAADTLLKANFVIRNNTVCFGGEDKDALISDFRPYKDYKEQLLCVGGTVKKSHSPSAGSGDSGGPAICRGTDGNAVLCGVTSFVCLLIVASYCGHSSSLCLRRK